MTQTLAPDSALQAAVDLLGSQGRMARLCGVRQPSVWRWLNRQRRLPAEHVLKVEAATGISRHDLRPDIYPIEIASTDGREVGPAAAMVPPSAATPAAGSACPAAGDLRSSGEAA